MPPSNRIWFFFLVLLIVSAAASVFRTTEMGIGLDPDSTSYIGAARGILQGKGLATPFTSALDAGDFAPMTHFPPLYPLSLAGFGLLGIDPQIAARILAVLLFPLNIFLASALVYFHTRHGLPTLIAALLTLFSLDILKAHSMAWSEPLFISLTLVTVFLLTRYMESPSLLYLIGASLSASLGFLCRYAGISWMIGGATVSFLWGPRPLRLKMKHVGAFGTCSLLVVAPWFLRNFWVSGRPIDRTIVFHPVSPATLLNALQTVGKWLLPAIISGEVLGGGIVIGLTLITCIAIRAAPSRKGQEVLYALLLFIWTYVLSLLVSISFVDYYTPLDERILAPVHVLAVLLVLSALHTLSNSPALKPIRGLRLWRSTILWVGGSLFLIIGGILADPIGFGSKSGLGSKQLSLIFLGSAGLAGSAMRKIYAGRVPVSSIVKGIALAMFLGWFAYPALDWIIHVHDGLEFASQRWQNSQVIVAVKKLPEGIPIYSNGYDVIYIHSERPTKILPVRFIPQTIEPNPDFYAEIQTLGAALQKGGLLVWVDGLDRDYFPSEQELLQYLPLQPVLVLPDGRIYQAKKPLE